MSVAKASLPARRDGSTLAYVVLLSLGVLDAAGYSIIGPMAPAIARETGAGAGAFGALVASFPAGILVGFALAGLAIRRGRTHTALVVALVLLAAGSLAFAVGGSLAAYFPARFVMGLGSGGVWMGVTFETLERWPGQEYLCMSRIFAAYSVGALVGPALGAIGGVTAPSLAYLALVILAIPAVLTVGPVRSPRPFASDWTALRLPSFWLASVGILFATLTLGLIDGALPLHFASLLSQAGIGALYAGSAVVLALAAAVAARFAPRRALTVALALVVLGVAGAGLSDTVPLWVLTLAFAALGVGFANTGSVGVLLEGVPTERIVTAMVVWSQVGIIGYLIGPLVGGPAGEEFGFGVLGLVAMAAAIPVAVGLARR